jgi:hypothetical protein
MNETHHIDFITASCADIVTALDDGSPLSDSPIQSQRFLPTSDLGREVLESAAPVALQQNCPALSTLWKRINEAKEARGLDVMHVHLASFKRLAEEVRNG